MRIPNETGAVSIYTNAVFADSCHCIGKAKGDGCFFSAAKDIINYIKRKT